MQRSCLGCCKKPERTDACKIAIIAMSLLRIPHLQHPVVTFFFLITILFFPFFFFWYARTWSIKCKLITQTARTTPNCKSPNLLSHLVTSIKPMLPRYWWPNSETLYSEIPIVNEMFRDRKKKCSSSHISTMINSTYKFHVYPVS